jgi:AraC family transcriptional regulator, regulatory protein of adaptative response / methylated-DNA-[protein]-cysteine methyltransferase
MPGPRAYYDAGMSISAVAESPRVTPQAEEDDLTVDGRALDGRALDGRALDEDRWAAVLGRDRAWDGRFVTAVSSTRIYCRPSCPARRPARERVHFYATPADARADGYRACRRCLPDLGADSPALELVRHACAILDEPSEVTPTLAQLGKRVGVSPSHLQRTFKRIAGVSPRAYADARRQGVLRERLRSQVPVADAIYEAGYGSSSRVYEGANAQLGMTPGLYRNGAAGATIRYTILETALGTMLVAATERGLCRVTLGESPDALERSLGQEFPSASRTRDDDVLAPMAAALLARTEGRAPAAELPLDIRATAFQRQVWETLKRIPVGTTRSYSQVAASIGRPGAARAVARACASNPVAIAIPCHRVVRGDGELGGYRWGIERKRRLLEIESGR